MSDQQFLSKSMHVYKIKTLSRTDFFDPSSIQLLGVFDLFSFESECSKKIFLGSSFPGANVHVAQPGGRKSGQSWS